MCFGFIVRPKARDPFHNGGNQPEQKIVSCGQRDQAVPVTHQEE